MHPDAFNTLTESLDRLEQGTRQRMQSSEQRVSPDTGEYREHARECVPPQERGIGCSDEVHTIAQMPLVGSLSGNEEG